MNTIWIRIPILHLTGQVQIELIFWALEDKQQTYFPSSIGNRGILIFNPRKKQGPSVGLRSVFWESQNLKERYAPAPS